MKKTVICPYCEKQAVFMTSKEYYGKDYKTNVWLCRPCDAYVGTHGQSRTPLGTLANGELREWRRKAHYAVDPLWKTGGLSRKEVYLWMQESMNISSKEAHIGMMNKERCQQLVLLGKKKRIQLKG